jgi:hypothetical protein
MATTTISTAETTKQTTDRMVRRFFEKNQSTPRVQQFGPRSAERYQAMLNARESQTHA